MSALLSRRAKKWLGKRINEQAEKVEQKVEHLVCDIDGEVRSYCYKCAQKEVERLSKKYPNKEFYIDGGWGHDNDYQVFCERCDAVLDNSYTETACDEDFNFFSKTSTTWDWDDVYDCMSVSKILDALEGWLPYKPQETKIEDWDEYLRLHFLGQKLLRYK